MVLLDRCYYSSNGSVYKAIVTTLPTGSRFGQRKGGFKSKNLEGSSFNRSTPPLVEDHVLNKGGGIIIK